MAETTKVARVGGFLPKLIPKPSIDIVKFWQGIVEIAVRVALLLFLLITFGVCSAAQGQSNRIDLPQYNAARAGAGWATFVGVIAFIYEVLFIITRFLVFPILVEFRTIYYIVDIVAKSVVALCLFTAFISLAVYAQFSHGLAQTEQQFRALLIEVGNAIGGAAFFAFICLALCVFIAVWMVLYLILKWDTKSPSSGGSSVDKS